MFWGGYPRVQFVVMEIRKQKEKDKKDKKRQKRRKEKKKNINNTFFYRKKLAYI